MPIGATHQIKDTGGRDHPTDSGILTVWRYPKKAFRKHVCQKVKEERLAI